MTEASQYLLLDRVARGGMAEIYRAKSLGIEGFERIVAIKRILPALADDAEFVDMFVAEAKIAGQLSHANIAPIYELGKMGAAHFIAMEYVWGKDLREILGRFKRIGQPMPPPMAAWIGSKMLEALDYAHRKRGPDGQPLAIIHRDVSPQNVLVSYDGLVKLIDFGIAKAASRATQTQAGVLKGKLAYMSPEQVRGLPLDHRSDIFAAAACIHELLTGERLFSGANDIEIFDKVREATAAPPSATAPHVPPALDAIVMTGLAREPSDRYRTAGEMHEALMGYIVSQRPPYGTGDLTRWMRIAFAPEMASERAHLERLDAIARPGERVGAEAASAPLDDVAADELSQIVVVEDIEASRSALQAVPAPEPPSPAAPSLLEPPIAAPTAPAHEAPAPYIPPAMPEPPARPQQAPLHAQHVPPQPAPLPPPRGSMTPLPIAAPRMSAETFVNPASSTQPPSAARRWPLVIALLFLLLATGGAAAWIFAFGGRALLGF